MFDGFYKTSPYTAGSWRLYINSSGYVDFLVAPGGGTTSYDTTSASTVTLNSWNHAAIVRNGTTITVYLNGVAGTPFTYSGVIGTGYSLALGAATLPGGGGGVGQYFPGFISNARIINGTALYTTNFTPSTTPLTAIANTSLLTLQNSTIVDNSTNAFTLTPTGTVKVSQNQPFASPTSTSTATTPSVYGSGYFDPSASYPYLALPASSAAGAFGTSDFTIELWFNATYAFGTSGQGRGTMIGNRTASSSQTSFNLYHYNGGIAFGTPSTDLILSATGILLTNTWYHLAVSRQSGTIRLFLNGVSIAAPVTGNSTNFSDTTPVQIGNEGSLANNYSFTGYLSGVRIVKGTAIYTNSFIPPAIPVTAVANTALLTLQYKNGINNNIFQDDSVNNFALTRTGTPTQGTFTPFSQTGWSYYFPTTGSVGYISANASPIATTTSTFSVECWINMPLAPVGTTPTVIGDMTPAGNSDSWSFGPMNSSPVVTLYWYDGSTRTVSGNTVMSLNTWYHIALTVNSNAISMYVNGVQQTLTGTTTLTNRAGSVGYLAMGEWTSAFTAYYYGYVSNLRITNTALYTSSFTPPTSPLTAISGTVFLTAQSNRFVDKSTSAYTLTPTAAYVVPISPFAPGVVYSTSTTGGSMYFNGSTDYINSAGSSTVIGTGDFTIEFWAYVNAAVSSAAVFVDMRASGSAVAPLIYMYTSNVLYYAVGATNQITGPTLVFNQWYHIAVSRASGSTKMFVNGVQVGSTYSDSNSYVTQASRPLIGSFGDTVANRFNGYISNLRVVNQALYTTTFTSSSSPFFFY